MDDLRHSFDPIFFTPEEKEHLTARLKQAAEQEDNMKDSTKRTIHRTSHRLILGVAVAAALTTGALAAAVGGGLLGYFEARTPEDRSALEEGIYQLNRSETYNGWTVELTDCVGDDTNVYLWVDVTAPEGTILAPLHDGWFYGHFSLEFPAGVSGTVGSGIEPIPDQNPQDNRISFCLELTSLSGNLRGQVVDLTLDPIVDVWLTDPGTGRAVQHRGSELTQAIRDHVWVFEEVALDFPDQAVRLTPNIQVPYLDGTATLTKVEITPLTTTVRIEGGSCYDHHGRAAAEAADVSGELVIDAGSAGSITLTGEDASTWFECWDALETTLVMKDGTTLEPPQISGGASCQDGVSNEFYQGVPYVEEKSRYAENHFLIDPRVIDPSQVDYILVCGVRVDLP